MNKSFDEGREKDRGEGDNPHFWEPEQDGRGAAGPGVKNRQTKFHRALPTSSVMAWIAAWSLMFRSPAWYLLKRVIGNVQVGMVLDDVKLEAANTSCAEPYRGP